MMILIPIKAIITALNIFLMALISSGNRGAAGDTQRVMSGIMTMFFINSILIWI